MKPRELHRLDPRTLHKLPNGKHNDGGGLYFMVSHANARSWCFRYRAALTKGRGGRSEIGLGSLLVVSIEEARERSDTYRRMLAHGVDPLSFRRATDMVREAAQAELRA
jgi:hypothetical protein